MDSYLIYDESDELLDVLQLTPGKLKDYKEENPTHAVILVDDITDFTFEDDNEDNIEEEDEWLN